MSRRVFLHVGSPKTGTTFLQQVLWAQRDLARDQGLLLPLDRFASHYYACLDVRELAREPHLPPSAAGSWDRLVEEALGWPGDVLVSHELFSPATAEQAARAVASFDGAFEVHVVVTARDLVRQIPAEWQQHLKSRATVTLPAFIAGIRDDQDRTSWFWRVQDVPEVVRRWGGSLPGSQVHVVTVPPASSPPSVLWERFASVVGLQPESFRLDGFRSNTSLGVEQAELLRLVNLELGERLPKPGPYHATVILVLAHQIMASRRGRPLGLEPADRAFAAELSRRLAHELAALEVDVVGDLSDLVPAAEPPGEDPGRSGYPVGVETVLPEAVAALAGLLDAYSSQRSAAAARRRELRGRLDEARARLATARAQAGEVRAELRQSRSREAQLRQAVADLEQRLAGAEAARAPLAGGARRAVRKVLGGVNRAPRPPRA